MRPKWNTCCPVAAMEFMESIQGKRWKPYCKFFPKTKQYGQNIGDVAKEFTSFPFWTPRMTSW